MDLLTRLATKLDPSLVLLEMGFASPDPWQRQILRSTSERMLVLCHRQAGKSTAVSGLAVNVAAGEPDSLVLIVSASLRQSGEVFRKVCRAYKSIGTPWPIVEDNATTLALANGSRIVSLPDSPETIVGYSGPKLIIIDEAARTSDETFRSIAPMLAISRGRLVALSTPLGRRGWFFEAWQDDAADWERVMFTADQNPRLDPVWLAEQRSILGPRWYSQDFLCTFEESVGQVFSTESILAAFTSTEAPLFGA